MKRSRRKAKRFACPCCGEVVLRERGTYEICPRCGWEDDPVQSADPDFRGGANTGSLHEAQILWRLKQSGQT